MLDEAGRDGDWQTSRSRRVGDGGIGVGAMSLSSGGISLRKVLDLAGDGEALVGGIVIKCIGALISIFSLRDATLVAGRDRRVDLEIESGIREGVAKRRDDDARYDEGGAGSREVEREGHVFCLSQARIFLSA